MAIGKHRAVKRKGTSRKISAAILVAVAVILAVSLGMLIGFTAAGKGPLKQVARDWFLSPTATVSPTLSPTGQ